MKARVCRKDTEPFMTSFFHDVRLSWLVFGGRIAGSIMAFTAFFLFVIRTDV